MTRVLWAIALAALAAAASAQATPPGERAPSSPAASSPSYALDWSVLDANGGGRALSAGFRVDLTLGQTGIGVTSGPSGRAEMGFWYGVDRALFGDGFESGDTSAWDSVVGEG